MNTLVKRVLISMGAFAGALAIAEFVTRTVVMSRTGATDFASYRMRCLGESIPIFERDDAGELIDCKPGLSQGDRIHINQNGFRGPDVLDPKPADAFRICCIGGSGCFGTTSSSDATTIPASLEAVLRLSATMPEHVEVMNGGLPGATTYMALLRFEKRLSRFKPDIVILYNLVNDLLTSRRARLGLDPRTRPAVRVDGVLTSWLSHSAMWLVFATARSDAAKKRDMEEVTKSESEKWNDRGRGNHPKIVQLHSSVDREKQYRYDGKIENNIYIVPEHLAQFREQLHRFRDAAVQSGANPVFCTFAFRFTGNESAEEYRRQGPGLAIYMPDWEMARDAMRAMNDVIRDVARETGSALCDVDRELVRKPGLYPDGDTDHFTDAGCREVGRIIAESLTKKGLLARAAIPRSVNK